MGYNPIVGYFIQVVLMSDNKNRYNPEGVEYEFTLIRLTAVKKVCHEFEADYIILCRRSTKKPGISSSYVKKFTDCREPCES